MTKSSFAWLLTVGTLFLTVLFFSGCSPQERSGVSRIPHNRPASWEYSPFAR